MLPSIPRGVEMSHPSTGRPAMFDPFRELLNDDNVVVSGNHYGDLIRNLLMTSCSAPVDPRTGMFRGPQWNVERHVDAGHYNYNHSDVSMSEPSTSAPPECSRRPSVVMALGHPPVANANLSQYWFATKTTTSPPSPLSRPPSVQILSPPPTPSPIVENMDVVALRQIDEFEELIEKIDRLNDMRTDGNVESFHSLSPHSPPPPPFRDADHSVTSDWPLSGQACPTPNTSAIDDDLETLLEENPSLLDIPGVNGGVTGHESTSEHRDTRTTNERMNGGDFENCDDSAGLKCNIPSTGFARRSDHDVNEQQADDERQCQINDQCQQRNPVVGGLTSPLPTRRFGPPTSLKSATMTTRTNLKQLLQMQQFHEMERKEQSKTGPVSGPPAMSTSVSVPMQPILPSRMEVPSEVLKVHSRLENPTRYHVQENQKRQVQEYLSTTQGNARSILAQSVPNAAIETTSSSTVCAGSSAPLMSSSAPSPGSPNSVVLSSSAATSVTSEADVIESIMQLESSMDVEHAYMHQTSTLPATANFMDVLKMNSANSCPADVPVEGLRFTNDNQLHAIAKDRQKKDNHNMIERRRRFNINDRIKELGTLLPRSNDPYYDMIRVDRQNKGTILKATVDYVKQMKRELDRMKLELGEKDHENRKLRLQNVQLAAMQSHSNGSSGIEVNWPETLTGQSSSTSVAYHAKEELRIKEEPVDVVVTASSSSSSSDHHHHHHHHLHLLSQQQQMSPFDDLMDEDEPVHGDPLLSSSMLGNTL